MRLAFERVDIDLEKRCGIAGFVLQIVSIAV
jgi:hypothetical protein